MKTNAISLNNMLKNKNLNYVGVYHQRDLAAGILWYNRQPRYIKTHPFIITDSMFMWGDKVEIPYTSLHTMDNGKFIVVTKGLVNLLFKVV
jgi:hypothetical protein